MEDDALIGLLKAGFGETLRATREGGRQSMAELIAARSGLPMEQAVERVDGLVAAGHLHFSVLRDMGDDSTLEAARYGTIPEAGSREGSWEIGSGGGS